MSFTEGPLHERSDIIVQEPVATVVDVPANGQVVVPAAPGVVQAAPVVEQVVVPAPVSTGQVRTAYASRFAPDSIIAGIAGLVILVTGLIAIVRGGFDGPMSIPVVHVLGFTHTTTLGLIEIAIGGALLLSAATRSRSGEVFFGAVLASPASSGRSKRSRSSGPLHWSRRWPGLQCSSASWSCSPP